jgi:hypothetical protein
MNDALAHERLNGVLELIDRWGDLYERRWGYRHPQGQPYPALEQQVKEGIDEVRKRTRLADDVIVAIGENELAAKVVEHEEGSYGGHPFSQARRTVRSSPPAKGMRVKRVPKRALRRSRRTRPTPRSKTTADQIQLGRYLFIV